jgi:uncharacterized protein (DUF2141 family)
VVHDENGDDELEKNIFGFPKEGLGFSNDASISFGPPSFSKASFPMGKKNKTITVKISY